ncbi:MAG: hypothetical protein KKC37_16190, partial [Proteobacteria bacterium]|nr:hypothetical protein [Pseudomonadota bacterium]
MDQWRLEGLLIEAQGPETPDPDPIPKPAPFVPAEAPRTVRVYCLLDRTIRLRFGSAELKALVDPLLAHARVADDEPPDVTLDLHHGADEYVLLADGRLAARRDQPWEFKAAVLTEILSAVHPGQEWIAHFHAAVVGLSGGRKGCIVLSAGGGSGKTTLAAALARVGFPYMSDDTTALDRAQSRVAAAPFALSVKAGGREALAGHYPGIHDLPIFTEYGAQVRYLAPPPSGDRPPARLPARLIIFPGYSPGAPASIHRLSGLEALERLVRSGAWISPEPEDVIRVIDWIRRTPAFEMTFDSLDQAVALVREVSAS